jgi:hypothetical protein
VEAKLATAIEWICAVSSVVVGVSHVLQPAKWMQVFRYLHQLGRAGAYVNGVIAAVPGLTIVIGHRVWSLPGLLLTMLGWLLMAKAMLCFIAPDKALKSMDFGARSRTGFVVAGLLLLFVGLLACYWLWLP